MLSVDRESAVNAVQQSRQYQAVQYGEGSDLPYADDVQQKRMDSGQIAIFGRRAAVQLVPMPAITLNLNPPTAITAANRINQSTRTNLVIDLQVYCFFGLDAYDKLVAGRIWVSALLVAV
jgi:hypothetical protein